MQLTRLIMGMPITVDIVDQTESTTADEVFAYFNAVDRRFSPFKDDSELAAINRGDLLASGFSPEMREVLMLAERTKHETFGFFDIETGDGRLDPSGVVKGWAILNAARIVERSGSENYFVDAGGDVQSAGRNHAGADWSIGIRNPFCEAEIIKVVYPRGRGVATSGIYARGHHIYDPHGGHRPIDEIVSLTVVGPDVFEADRFATGAFAMGQAAAQFIEQLPGFEAYQVNAEGRATMTSGFGALCEP